MDLMYEMRSEEIICPKKYEKRSEEIICPKNGKSIIRIARFLNPTARNINQLSEIPKDPLVADFFTYQNLQKWPSNVQFSGWNNPQKNWDNWFDRLVINHATTWIRAGIIDGIHASLHEIPCNKDLVLGVSEFWCSKTSSFIFPWGEATITFEDVMILGGVPVVGVSQNKPWEEEIDEIEFELRRVKRKIAAENYRSGGKRVATHDGWLKHFMEEEEEGEIDNEEGQFEHVAFLSLWLSRFVLPDLDEVIDNYVFPMAIHLSKGNSIALAPVVLANLYNDLTLLTKNAIELPFKSKYYASGLFKIVQLWVCERFPEFGANLMNPLGIGDPRVARWENVNIMVTLPFVRSRLKLGEGFQWRPYASELEYWQEFPFYKESEQVISNCAVLDDCLLSFARFLYPCEINGHQTYCKEKYQPHRVAMQFGYDQDLPGEFTVSDIGWNKGGLYIPSKTFDAGMSRSYHNWWKDSILRREEAVDDYFKRERDQGSITLSAERQESERCEAGNKGKSLCASLKPDRDKGGVTRSTERQESERCEPGNKRKSVCASPRPDRDKGSITKSTERQESERCEAGNKRKSVCASPMPDRDKGSVTRSTERQESERCEPGNKGKSVCASPNPDGVKGSVTRSTERQESERCEPGNKGKSVCASAQPDWDKGSVTRLTERQESERCEPGNKGKSVCTSTRLDRDKAMITRSDGRQEDERCESGNKGKSGGASPKPLLHTPDTSSLDHVPLSLRLRPSVEFKKAPRSNIIRTQVSGALKSPQVRIKASHDSNIGNEVIVADKKEPSDSFDTVDHMPLALRIQSVGQSKGALKPLENHTFTENVRNSYQERNQTEELASGESDADSYVFRRGSSPEKTLGEANRDVEDNKDDSISKAELYARLADIEKIMASLGVAKLD